MIHLAEPNEIGYQKKTFDYTFSHWDEYKYRFESHTRTLNYPAIGPTILVEWKE